MDGQTTETKLLTRPETARRLRVSLPTLDNWARAGKGPEPTRLGPRRVFYSAASVENFIKQQAKTMTTFALTPEALVEEADVVLGPDANTLQLAELVILLRKVHENIVEGRFSLETVKTFSRAIRIARRELFLIAKREPFDALLVTEIIDDARRLAIQQFPEAFWDAWK